MNFLDASIANEVIYGKIDDNWKLNIGQGFGEWLTEITKQAEQYAPFSENILKR